ncbi:MAG: signal peptide peptidase SppA [Candidatus Liberibacter ctenarytainae]|uniref:Signal peptide peptidase SppA n=1 Tax=Candidatus Liberibacter ctenarytainae TaxID=2020335 RepID=A0A937APQ5_9HYPH|nr:signal peptide peptidase SppA [Candidatus Liberibacter ctenarytainae]
MTTINTNILKKIKFKHVVLLIIAFGAINLFWGSIFKDKRPHIARITIAGVIDDNPKLIERIERIKRDDTAKALIVTLSSPGGTVYGAESVFRALQAFKKQKPVIADIHSMAASGAYMVACASNTIVASHSSQVGSIGVILPYMQAKNLSDKIGVSFEAIKSSPMKGEPSQYRSIPKESLPMLQNLVSDYYHWFVKIVSDSRHIPYEKTLLLSDGSIWSGKKAKELGLIDIIGGEEEILNNLYSLGVDKNIKLIKDWNAPESYWNSVFETLITTLETKIPMMKQVNYNGPLAIWQ